MNKPTSATATQVHVAILIVDDSQTLRLSMRRMLEGLGHRIFEAENGLAGLDVLQAHPEIRLVLVDYNMPEMNGIDMLRQMQAMRRQEGVHCVIITSLGQQGSELLAAAKQAGAVAWLTKPIQVKQVQNLIRKLGI